MSDRGTKSWATVNGSNFYRSTLFFTFAPIARETGFRIGSIISGQGLHNIMPAATVAYVISSTRITLPVNRFFV